MCINIESLIKNICYWHKASELPEPYKQVFIKYKDSGHR